MMNIITSIIDSFFPPRASELLVRTLVSEKIIAGSSILSIGDISYMLPYQDAAVSALITENKFHNNRTARIILSDVVAHWLRQQPGHSTVIPIPLSKHRKRERGYNQVTEILRTMTLPKNVSIQPELLLRKRHTVPQTQLERQARLKNLSNAFMVPRNSHVNLGRVIIIDDVTTTGATLQAAKAAIIEHDPTAHITLLAIAH